MLTRSAALLLAFSFATSSSAQEARKGAARPPRPQTVPDQAGKQSDLIKSWESMGNTLNEGGDPRGALQAFQKAAKLAEAKAAGDPRIDAAQWDVARTSNAVGTLAYQLRDYDTALSAHQRCLEISRQFAPKFPDDEQWQRALVGSGSNLGLILFAQGKTAEGAASFQEALALLAGLTKRSPKNLEWQHLLGAVYSNLAEGHRQAGQLDEAMAAHRQVKDAMAAGARRDPKGKNWAANFGSASRHIGELLEAQGKLEQAEEAYAEALVNHQSVEDAEALDDARGLKRVFEKQLKAGTLTAKKHETLKMIDEFVRAFGKDGERALEPGKQVVLPRCNVVIIAGHVEGPMSQLDDREFLNAALRAFGKSEQGPAQAFIFQDGFAPASERLKIPCETLKPSRQEFLALADKLASSGAPLVVLVFGSGVKEGEGRVFQFGDSQLTPADFRAFADKVSAAESHWVLYFRGSGTFASAIAAPAREIISSDSQRVAAPFHPIGLPLLLETLAADPAISMLALGQKLGQRTQAWYQERKRPRTETPTLWPGNAAPRSLISGDQTKVEWK